MAMDEAVREPGVLLRPGRVDSASWWIDQRDAAADLPGLLVSATVPAFSENPR